MTFIKAISVELNRVPSLAKDAFVVIGVSILLGLSAHLVIPLPFTPVPIITQHSLVLLMAVLLGSKRITFAVSLLLLQGAMGLPVFATGSGLAYLAGPTGGFLVGYLIGAYATAKLSELFKRRTILIAFLSMAVGNGLIFACGCAWLSTFVGVEKAFLLGFVPFVFWDLIKIGVAVKFLQWIRWDSQSISFENLR